eukprot:182163_1
MTHSIITISDDDDEQQESDSDIDIIKNKCTLNLANLNETFDMSEMRHNDDNQKSNMHTFFGSNGSNNNNNNNNNNDNAFCFQTYQNDGVQKLDMYAFTPNNNDNTFWSQPCHNNNNNNNNFNDSNNKHFHKPITDGVQKLDMYTFTADNNNKRKAINNNKKDLLEPPHKKMKKQTRKSRNKLIDNGIQYKYYSDLKNIETDVKKLALYLGNKNRNKGC